jgi:hypothetical protein
LALEKYFWVSKILLPQKLLFLGFLGFTMEHFAFWLFALSYYSMPHERTGLDILSLALILMGAC